MELSIYCSVVYILNKKNLLLMLNDGLLIMTTTTIENEIVALKNTIALYKKRRADESFEANYAWFDRRIPKLENQLAQLMIQAGEVELAITEDPILTHPSPGSGLTAFCNEARSYSHSEAMVNNLKPRVKGYPAYLEQIKVAVSRETDPTRLAELNDKLAKQTNLYHVYKEQLTEHEQRYNQAASNMHMLSQAEATFKSVSIPAKSLYTIDDETIMRYGVYKKQQDPSYATNKPFVFSLNNPLHLTNNRLDDFIRLSANNAKVMI